MNYVDVFYDNGDDDVCHHYHHYDDDDDDTEKDEADYCYDQILGYYDYDDDDDFRQNHAMNCDELKYV